MRTASISRAERLRSEAYLRITQAARDLSQALAAAQDVGLDTVVEVSWVTQNDRPTQEVVAYLAEQQAEPKRA